MYQGVLRRLRNRVGMTALGTALFFLISVTPFIVENARSAADTLGVLSLRLSSQEKYRYGDNLKERLREFHWQMSGIAYFHEQVKHSIKRTLELDYNGRVPAALFWGISGVVLFMRRFRFPRHYRLWVGMVLGSLLLLSLSPRLGSRWEHLLMLHPLPFLLMGSFLAKLWDRTGGFMRGIPVRLPMLLFLFLIFWTDLRTLRFYRACILKTGGYGEHSVALSALGEHVRNGGFRMVYFPLRESVMANTLVFLNRYRLKIRFVGSPDEFQRAWTQADAQTAFVKVYPWRSSEPYPLSVALDSLSGSGSVKRIPFLSLDGEMHFELFAKQ